MAVDSARVCHTGLEPQPSRPRTGLLLTRASLALDRPPPPKPKPPVKEVVPLIDADYQAMYMDSAKKATYAAVGLLGVGMISPNNPHPHRSPLTAHLSPLTLTLTLTRLIMLLSHRNRVRN